MTNPELRALDSEIERLSREIARRAVEVGEEKRKPGRNDAGILETGLTELKADRAELQARREALLQADG